MQISQGRNDAGDAAHEGVVRAICARHANAPAALIEILHDVQSEIGYVPTAIVPTIGDALNLSRAEVHGVVTFYHDFRRTPAGRHILKLCRAEACQSMGAESLIRGVERSLGVSLGNTTADGRVTLEAVYCLGNCALAPAAMIDGRLIGRATPQRLESQLATATLARANAGANP